MHDKLSGLDSVSPEGIPEKARGEVGIISLEYPGAHNHAAVDVDNDIRVVEPARVLARAHEKYNDTRSWFLKADRLNMGDNVLTDALNVWKHDNPAGIYPNGFDVKYASSSDFWVEKADFLRLKSLTLGYTFPKSWGKGILSNARIYVDLQNLFVLTNYSGSDPETDSYSAYPYQRTYSLGLNINF